MADYRLLEINLISAQSLKRPAKTNLRSMQTYAVAWVDPSAKLRTRVDRVGGENPTWNDKFIFRVSSSFLSPSSSSTISLHIYAVGCLLDTLIGTVRVLVANLRLSSAPFFTAFQIRRPSGRFHGILNVGATLLPSSFLPSITGAAATAIGYRDLMGENPRALRRHRPPSNSCGSSPAADSPVGYAGEALKDWNGREGSSDGGGILCGLGFQRRIHHSPSDQNLLPSEPSDERNR